MYKKQENHAIKFLPGGVDTIHIGNTDTMDGQKLRMAASREGNHLFLWQ